MAASEESSLSPGDPRDEGIPLRLLDQRIRQLTETILPHTLTRLKQHKENIVALHRETNWKRLNTEQINASRTVQQLKSHVRALEDIRDEVRGCDQRQFDSRVEESRREVLCAIEAYVMVQCSVREGGPAVDEMHKFEELTIDEQSTLIPKEEAALESWEELKRELVELNELVGVLAAAVKEQESAVGRISEAVDGAGVMVKEGEKQVETARGLKSFWLTGAVVGGVLGGVVGGPVGALVGVGTAVLTATAGSAVGAVGGAYIGHRRGIFRRSSGGREEEELKKEQ